MSDSTTDKAGRRGGLPEDDSLDAFAAAANTATAPRRRRRAPAPPPIPADADQPAQAAGKAEEEAPGPKAPTAPPTPLRKPKPEPEPEVGEPSLPAPAASPDQASPSTDLATTPPATPDRVPAAHTRAVRVRDLGPQGQRATQCTVMVSANVRDRFAAYQLAKKMEKGREPTNAVVVRRAVLHARKKDLFTGLLEAVRHRQQPADEEDYDEDGLFGDVPARRAERGRMKDSVQQSFRPSYQELEVIDAITAGYGFPSRSDFLDAALDAFLPPLPKGHRSR